MQQSEGDSRNEFIFRCRKKTPGKHYSEVDLDISAGTFCLKHVLSFLCANGQNIIYAKKRIVLVTT